MPLVMFLDESGDHSLSKIDPQYPLFVLCGVLLSDEYHKTTATEALKEFKQNLFGLEDLILHTVDFARNQAGFESMADHSFRARFFQALEDLVIQLDFKLVACVIRKQAHLDKYGLNALDPYMLSLSVLVERFAFECGGAGGTIVAESRDETLNNALELAFLDLKIRGTDFIPATKIRRRIHNFVIRDKQENIAGLQIADVCATPIGRHLLGKTTYPDYCRGGDFFLTVQPKFRKDWQGNYRGMGLVVLPK